MTAGPWLLTNGARTKLCDGTLATSASYKVALFTADATIGPTSTTYGAIGAGEVSSTDTGYTTGGAAITPLLSGTNPVAWKFTSNPEWTAGSADLAAKTAVLYETSGGYILTYALLDAGGATVTIEAGNILRIDSDGSPNPVLNVG